MRDSVLVTGSSTGLGLETAVYLAERGFEVYASMRNLERRGVLEDAAARRNVEVHVLQLDITDRSSIDRAVRTVVERSDGIYGLVNSAGIGLRGFFEDLAEEEIRQLFEVNVFGAMSVTREVLPHMRVVRRGRIVIIGSAGGRVGSMTISAYCASKFALEGFGESLASEVAPLGLYVSLIEPGLVMTPHFTVNRGRAKAATDPNSPYHAWFVQHEKLVDDILRANRITPVDVARAVHRALTAKRPRLRYVVGWRAKLLIWLRRYLPAELFERVYSWQMTRLVTKPRRPAKGLSELSIPGVVPTDCLGLDPARMEMNRND